MIIMIPILNRLPIFGKRRIDTCRQLIKNIALQMINQRKHDLTRATCKRSDLLDLLLTAHGENKEQKFTDDEVSDEAITFSKTAIVDNTLVASDGKQIYIPKGTDVMIHLNIMNSSEKYWDEPNKFNPARFLEGHSPVTFPFGLGPRTCIGQNFAVLESIIILALLLHRFHFELVPGQKIVLSSAGLARPKHGVSMRIWPR
ncbi:unnamed protein product [Rotaria sp. Silwood1]|nr:unnamed protein product [Rotaria sp. Silwood1]CAF1612820.1 unnamed protein product [Rotaria sp. Silwood1]CAF3753145.1 unnamed protein product [Rotaria sp. Silwood1]CAF3755883.1 unnamed protein product [Rotaria sp. Silwood1]CAF4591604.1 unnamed protein product [Rotaria sp. Silwood1]